MSPEDREELAFVFLIYGFGGLMSWLTGPLITALIGFGVALILFTRREKEG